MSRLMEHFNYLHTIPERGMEEFKTSEYLADCLEQAGYEVTRHVGGKTGVVGVWDSGVPGPVLGLRADMDALTHIIDGVRCARHTCGHDGHSSMVLTAAEEAKAQGLVKKGKLKILFQPAEELSTGAPSMIEGGAIDDVDILIGAHIQPAANVPTGCITPAVPRKFPPSLILPNAPDSVVKSKAASHFMPSTSDSAPEKYATATASAIYAFTPMRSSFSCAGSAGGVFFVSSAIQIPPLWNRKGRAAGDPSL